MKKLAWLLFIFVPVWVMAQKVTVSKKSEKIKSESAEGYKCELEGKKDDVADAWNKFLKDIGKLRSGSSYSFVEHPTLGSTVYTTGILYAECEGNDEKATVWAGIKGSEWTVNDLAMVEKQVENLVYQFGVKYYRDKIQAQIDESQRALDAVVRQQQRLTTQQKDLTIKLSNNEQEKIQLDKAIESNKLEHLVTIQKIENNKKSQDSVALAGEQIKKVIEMHKERQRKVN